MTRRQALGGLLGGGALLGAAGSASAQSDGNGDDSPFGEDFPFGEDDDSASGGGNPPWAPDDHDHSGDYLGEGKPVDRINTEYLSTDGLNGVRMLSSFDSLQAAFDYSTANDAPVFVDGEYKTTETNVSVEGKTQFFGIKNWSEINYVGSSAEDFLVFSDEKAFKNIPQWDNFTLRNSGNGQKAISYTKGDYGFLSNRGYMSNLYIVDWGGDYAVDIRNAYGTPFYNIIVRRCSGGAFRFWNCNASRFLNLTAIQAGDGETPVIYITHCLGTTFVSPYLEFTKTDSTIQVSDNSRIALINPYIEARSAANCAVQIGDGGITEGNTRGKQGADSVWMLGGFFRGFGRGNNTDAVRLLNSLNTRIVGVATANFTNGFNVEGSTTDDKSELSTSVEKTVVENNQTYRVKNVVKPGSGGFLYKSGEETTSVPTVSSMIPKEIQRGKGTGPNGEDEFFYKATTDRISRFTAEETITR